MFSIGFYEILVIALIGLIFIGPERLPETVRTLALYFGRFKRSLRETRRELEQQLGADEIRRELHNEEVMKSLEKLRKEVKEDIDKGLDFEDDLYPPGHHDHDPNNDIDPEGEVWRPDMDNDAPPETPSDSSETVANENTIEDQSNNQTNDGDFNSGNQTTDKPS